MDIADLPRDLFLLVIANLSARAAVLCRRVSRRWHGAFTDGDTGLQLLKWHFPRCREARLAFAAAAAADDGIAVSTTGYGTAGHDAAGDQTQPSPQSGASGGSDAAGAGVDTTDWAAVFAGVASRYHHLRTATPRAVDKVRHGATEDGWAGRFLPVGTWDRHLRLNDRTAPFHYPDPGWCYGQEDGLLVYHVYEEGGECPACPWRWLDLETRREGTVPFAQGRDRVVRRVRLADGVLIFEWCQRPAGHHPDRVAEAMQHYVTVYDVMCVTPATTDSHKNDREQKLGSGSGTWTITQRTGFHLNLGPTRTGHRNSRFFSTHTNTHYAAYIWQGDYILQDGYPVETVVIRDIATTPGQQQRGLLRTLPWNTLDFYGVRQRSAPRLRCLGMDDRNLYLTEEEHRWARGAHSSPSPPRVHLVRTTGIPIIPAPPAPGGQGAWGGGGGGQEADQPEAEPRQVTVEGPRWVDECGADGDVNMSFCSRAAAGNPHHPRHGAPAAPRQHTLLAGGRSGPTSPGIWNGDFPPGGGAGAAASLAREVEAGIRAPAGRWPGWAPCWRHEEFPYLTVSEMVDFRAGVRVTARHCFMLETLSVHVRPSLSVRGLGGGAARDDGDGEGRSSESSDLSGRRLEKTSGDEDSGNDEEVQFADEMWDALLGKGFICGDERWLIGEDRQGCINILRF